MQSEYAFRPPAPAGPRGRFDVVMAAGGAPLLRRRHGSGLGDPQVERAMVTDPGVRLRRSEGQVTEPLEPGTGVVRAAGVPGKAPGLLGTRFRVYT